MCVYIGDASPGAEAAQGHCPLLGGTLVQLNTHPSHAPCTAGSPTPPLPPPPQAVRDDWYFQMYYDNLPVWGFIGKVEKIIPKQVRALSGLGRGLGGGVATCC